MKLIAALLAIWLPLAANAHTGDRVFSISYLSADDLAYIELDGDLTDWKDLFVEPTFTALDFTMFAHRSTSYSQYDPANLDFRIWMAWSDGGKIYVAAEAADDVYRSRDVHPGIHYFNDHIVLSVDGDHSGGRFIYPETSSTSGPDPRNNAHAQYYEATSYSEQQYRLVALPFNLNRSWMTAEPYALGSGTVLGENPTFWTVEFYVTAFDEMFSLGPEDVVISSFEPGQIIGFEIIVYDWDHHDNQAAQFYLQDPNRESEAMEADSFIDAILLGPEQTAVEATTWARLKAAMKGTSP